MTVVDVLTDGSLYGSVMLPDLMIGTVGGGTILKTQTEARSIMKTDSPFVLAEVLGGAVLAGELSLLASLAEGSLAQAHTKLGR
jgi:hydroxymethylglutaryl-CoA reductase (NADPH)